MSARRERERLTGALAMLIDSKNYPPEPAALELARTVVALVHGRKGEVAIEISGALIRLAKRFPRRSSDERR